MNKQKLNKLYAMTEQLRDEYCKKFALQDREGTCCYDDGSNKVEFCPFSIGWICTADDFIDSLDTIVSSLNKGEIEHG